MKQSSISNAQKSVFSDSVLCFGRVLQHPDSNEAWKNGVAGIQSEKSYRDYDAINGESTEFEWNIFPGFTTLQLCGKINDLLRDLGQTPEICRCSMTSLANAGVENLVLDNGHSWDQVLKRSGILQRIVHKEPGTISEQMLLKFAESGHPTFRATTPLSRGILKSKRRGKLSIHFAAHGDTIDNFSHYLFCQSAQCLRSSGSFM